MRVMARPVEDYQRIRVEPLTGTLGAEVTEVDLRDLDEDTFAELQDAWLAHKVLFFRDQPLTQAQHVDYGKRYGELEIHPFVGNIEAQPEIIVLESTPEKFNAAEQWHTDVTFRERPAQGSILLGRIIPPYGGDTCFADTELAYELLDDATKALIEGRTATHSMKRVFGRNMSAEKLAEVTEKYPDQHHPIVRTHPVTGRRCLFVNKPFTACLDMEEMDPVESRKLLEKLWAQVTKPEVQCRFRWRTNSIAQWDNRCTQHYAVPDHGGLHRRVERVTLLGDKPF
ncbi:MAG: TauD/TfdA dioxygenase family protein [Acidimicrobiales bacterium]